MTIESDIRRKVFLEVQKNSEGGGGGGIERGTTNAIFYTLLAHPLF